MSQGGGGGSRKRRDRAPDDDAYPFRVHSFVGLLFRDLPWITGMTGSEEALERALRRSLYELRTGQRNLEEALGIACEHVVRICGLGGGPPEQGQERWQEQRQHVVDVFWRAAHHLRRTGDRRNDEAEERAAMTRITLPAGVRGVDERWRPTPRRRVQERPHEEMVRFREMNYHILEATVELQRENRDAFPQPDMSPVFTALAIARDAMRENQHPMTAAQASHYVNMAARLEVHEGALTTHALKGMRRWRRINPNMTIELAVDCLWRLGDPEVRRRHQLWHYQRIMHEHNIITRVPQSAVFEGSFLLLVGVISDYVFASIPPEDAADAVVFALFSNHQPNPRQRFDIQRLLNALRQPRSPYLHIVFPEQAAIDIDTWADRLALRLR